MLHRFIMILIHSSALSLPVMAQGGPAEPPAEPIRMSADECAVWARELGFAQAFEKKDIAAFSSFLHPDTVFNAATPAQVRGAKSVVEDWKDLIAGKTSVLRWRPEIVAIAGSLNVAVSRGIFVIEDKSPNAEPDSRYLIGQFGSVWVRANASSPWLIAYDGLGTPPTSAKDKKELDEVIAAAPKTCTR